MQKAVQEAPEKALPALAIPELETTDTAIAAFENLIDANVKEMNAQRDLAVGETRKVVAKIPTAEGQIEKRQVTLTARGAKGGIIAPGVVGGIERVEGKPTVVQKEEGISRRAVRLIKEFESSTDNVNKKIQNIWLGIKRFDKAAGTVDFSEALKDLADMQALLAEMLKNPLLSQQKFAELSQLKRKVGTAIRTVAETPAEGMKAVVMKGMETPESAKIAFKNQIALQKKAMWEDMNLAVGKTMTVAAAIPTTAGVAQKRQVQLRAVGEGGAVTGIEEVEYRTAKEYAKELGKGKKTRAGSLVKEFIEGSGDVNKRISTMVLGVKKFDEGLSKAGKHTKAINFDNAEKDLIGIIKLLDSALKGAVHLTEEERAAYAQARGVAKAMYQKVTKVPTAARKGISMAGYETPESSLTAHRSKMELETQKLIEANERGKSVVVKSRLMTETGEERPVSKRLTARGSRVFGFGGPVSRVSEREEVGGGQVGSVIRRVAMWGAASGVIYGILGGVRQMIQTMKQAETGLVNLKKVMSHVTTDFDHMRDSAVRFAKDYGAELMGVLETMRIFAQQGLPQEQVKEMARVSTLASNVTTMKPTEAAEALTSATRQFNIEGEKSISILDSWNEVENKFAITAKDLADGFKKAGTAAKITGIDVNKLNGIITAIGEATRQTGKEVGTSLKFIFSRMATEKAPRAMKAVGIETMEGGRLREGSAILDDLAVRWVTLTRSQKLATAQAIGGIRHYNALMVMMDNYDRALAATAASINSVGSAEKENAMIMETYEKKAAQMKASFDALAVSASGPILTALKYFADALKGVLEVMGGIPGAGLAAGGALAYGGATALGKYFDLSMFGLLGAGVGGAKRKRRGPMELLTAPFRGKREVGEGLLRKTPIKREDWGRMLVKERSPGWSEIDKKLRATGRSGGISLGPPVTKLDLVKKGLKGVGGAAKTAGFSMLGLISSIGMFGKIVIPIAVIGTAFYAFGKSVSKTFAFAKDRTKDYVESLDAIEEKLNAIGNIKLLRTRIEIETKRMGALEARTPEQRAAQIEGRSYKSPLLMRKQQIANVKEYAGAVAAMTSEGLVGFDRFGKAIISSTEDLGRVVDKLEAIGSMARLELKLHIAKEELEDLVKAPEIDTWIKVIHYKFRELLERMGKEWGTGWLGEYADKMRNPFESVLHSMKEINKLRREAGAYGEIISPPSEKLKKEDPDKYKKVKKRFDEYSKAQSEHLVATKVINEKFLEVRRDFFTLAGPGMTTGMAGQAAFGQTGRLLAEIEKEREGRFYEERGASVEDIQASFFQRLQGVNVRATAEITREAAAEQGIPFRPAEFPAERREMLAGARTKDILMFEKQAGIQGDMASVFEKNGELWVRYSEQVVKGGEKQLVSVEQTLAQFREMPKYAKEFVGIVSSMGMLTPTEMRLRAISRVSVGAEAGMFKPTKARKLDLGKKYLYQVPTEMLIQNDAFKSFSKTTVAFISEYIKKQSELRRQQKAALSIYEKRGAIAGETATQIELLTAELVKFSNTAIQAIRVNVELEKSLDQLNISSAKQVAVQKFRSETLRHLTGPMAGAPVLRTPKIDLRNFFDLTPHERLTVASKEYVSNVQDYNKTMDKYNVAVKKGEKGAAALADIEYIRGLAKEGADLGDIDELAKKISKTGDLASAQTLSELQKQTVLGQQTVSNLSNVVSLLGGGAASYAKAAKMPYGIDQKIAMSSAMEVVKTEMASALSMGDYDKFTRQRETLTDINKVMAAREKYGEQYKGATPEQTAALDKFFIAQAKVEETSGFRVKEGDVNRELSNLMLELASSAPDLIKKFVVGSKLVKKEEYPEVAKRGGLKEIIEGRGAIKKGELNIVAIVEYIKTLTDSGKILTEFNEKLRAAFGGVEEPQESILVRSTKPEEITNIESVLGSILQPTNLAEITEARLGGMEIPKPPPAVVAGEEAVQNIQNVMDAATGEIETYTEYLQRLGLTIREDQKALQNFDKASGQLKKTVGNLINTFRDLERASIVNQKLIETRAKYLSTRGGPMRQRAPSADIDVATTAQYSPHELLYNKSKAYKDTVTGYLKTAESLKAARSKIEEIAKIRGKAEFMGAQGYSKEQIEGVVEKALLTGSLETALMVSEQEKTNTLLESINKNTADVTEQQKEGKAGVGVQPGGIPGKEKSVYKSLNQLESEAQKAMQYAEQENIERAEYLRAKQIEKKTALDIAAGRGKTQDQINREESEYLTALGYVPEEVKDRNKKLVQVHKEEKAAREEWERARQESLKPLQQSASGMQSLIDSMRTGVTGIKGARNIRPLEIDFAEWTERQGTGEIAQERVADRRMQFDLAKSLYSQNLNLRAQGADTGVAPRRLYDIMEKASKGEDVTKDLEQIQKSLTEKKKEREEQIRKIQAEEYARAVKEVMTPHDEKLGSIRDNTDKLITATNDSGRSIVDAINTTGKAQPAAASMSGDLSKMTTGDIKAAKNINAPIITFPEEGESMADFTARTKQESFINERDDRERKGLFITPISPEAKNIFAEPTEKAITGRQVEQPITDAEKVVTMIDKVNEDTKLPQEITKDIPVDKQREVDYSSLKKKTKEDIKVGAEQIKETKNVNDEMSDLKDEIVTLKTSVSDVNKLFEKLSKGLDDVSGLGDKSKDSAALIETLGKSASDASSSLNTLSTKMDNVKSPEAETGPTMLAEEGHKYISEDSDIIKDLIGKTDDLVIGVNNIGQNMLELSEGLVTDDSFVDFKKEISSYFEDIGELKTSVEDLNKDMILNNDYTIESKKQFEIIIDRLQTYDTVFTKIEENISFMDHKFTDDIVELHEMVGEAMDLARSAYNFASQAINQI
jgi:TP901 family phage tail tape measure protein